MNSMELQDLDGGSEIVMAVNKLVSVLAGASIQGITRDGRCFTVHFHHNNECIRRTLTTLLDDADMYLHGEGDIDDDDGESWKYN